MKKFVITPKARVDLKDISRYTDKNWGRKQRLTYLKRLKDRFALLANHAQKGQAMMPVLFILIKPLTQTK